MGRNIVGQQQCVAQERDPHRKHHQLQVLQEGQGLQMINNITTITVSIPHRSVVHLKMTTLSLPALIRRHNLITHLLPLIFGLITLTSQRVGWSWSRSRLFWHFCAEIGSGPFILLSTLRAEFWWSIDPWFSLYHFSDVLVLLVGCIEHLDTSVKIRSIGVEARVLADWSMLRVWVPSWAMVLVCALEMLARLDWLDILELGFQGYYLALEGA